MRIHRAGWLAVLLLGVGPALLFGQEPAKVSPALADYVKAADDSFSWKLVRTAETDGGNLYEIDLVSQTWQGIRWRHVLVVHEPRRVAHDDQVLLFINGGRNTQRPSDQQAVRFFRLARWCAGRVAVLYQVPNQPLLGGRFEDDLITETFLRYLKTKDARWPLLFPMVKSAVRAIDALEAFDKKKWGGKLKHVVVTGGSKRGWTTWLTAVVDRRVRGLAPLVIDTLNFRVQMRHQKASWGRYSPQIRDYTRKGLIDLLEKKPELPLWRWVDPYTYRDAISQPKLIVNGTNDPYWVVDALNNYWDDLVGPKYILYIPNAGHGLDGGEGQLRRTLGAFFRSVALGRPLPQLAWKHGNSPGQLRLEVTSDIEPVKAELWSARSDRRDFRRAKWSAVEMRKQGKAWVGDTAVPDGDHVALYGHLSFQVGDLRYGLSTQVRVR